ncbi:flavodoxin family protein [Lacrimispora algidixylanolytica]|uniref:Flavodoxin n=1 Tax=Lacrimispora algidixylanolytica TaxID=94868 RepID=A0A419T785_9FIRM|nr:flavodoxin family protein [Lacrimispora algidixylanolytica]RKD33302.1 flavodoxin [Lacrimispora algidixylanolytica]
MNILIITGSPRRNGNTEIMADTFAESAKTAGHDVTIKNLSTLKVDPCLACQYCFTHDGTCIQQDDMNSILSDLAETDMLVLASPIYWFDVSAQTKAFVDRMYAFAKKGFRIKSIAMLLNSGAPNVYDAAEAQLNAICSYLKWENKGVIKISGMLEKGSMNSSDKLESVKDFAASLS